MAYDKNYRYSEVTQSVLGAAITNEAQSVIDLSYKAAGMKGIILSEAPLKQYPSVSITLTVGGTTYTEVDIANGQPVGTTFAVEYASNSGVIVLPTAVALGTACVATYVGTGTVNSIEAKRLFSDGTAASPGISFENDQDTGIYRNASGNIVIGKNGTNIFAAGSVGANPAQVFNSPGSVASPGQSWLSNSSSGRYMISGTQYGESVNGVKVSEINSLGVVNGTLGTDYRNLIQVVQGQTTTPTVIRTNTAWTTGANTNYNLVLQGAITPKSSSSIIKVTGFVTNYGGSSNQFIFLYLYRNTSSYGTPLSTSQAGAPSGNQLGSLMNQGNGNTGASGLYVGTTPILARSTGHIANTQYYISCWLRSTSNSPNSINLNSTLSEMYFEEWL
jgi:hypothetical protein